ncbi:hypothetical protein ACE5KN_30880, partial [Paenibacillus terreus]
MGTKLRTCEEVEKGFSNYIKLCLRHASRDYFKKLYRDSVLIPFDECEPKIAINIRTSTTITFEDFAVLS